MKQFCALGLIAALALAAQVLAEGPDDLFIRLYNLILQADTLQANGRAQEAQEKYLDAEQVLDTLETTFPKWNPKIVSYRRAYIVERLGPNRPPPRKTATPATGEKPETGGRATAASAGVPGAEADEGAAALNREIQALQAERDRLEAKLREALAVQPAAVDPRELAKAEKRIQELEKENQRLGTSVTQQQKKLEQAADPAALEEAQKALKEARKALDRQTESVRDLTREKQELEQKLRKATEKARSRTGRGESAPAAASASGAAESKAADEIRQRLEFAERELEAERRRSETLLKEKGALEQRLVELSAQKAGVTPPAAAAPPPPAVAAAPAAPVSAKPVTDSRTARAVEKQQIKMLERERDDLQKRVNVLTQELENRRIRSGSAQNDRLAEELSLLRARLQVYEARQVPFTAEERALFKRSADLSGRSEAALSRRAARQIPAGAATLVAEAQRAFQSRRLDEAERKFQQALVLDERNVALLTDLAATQIEQNQLEKAEATLKRAEAEDKNDPDVLSLLGLVRFRQDKYDEAFDILGRAAQLNPDNALTQNYLGVTLSQKGQRQAAETAFRKAIQLEPGYAEAHYNLAVAYARQKPPFPELAKWHYQKAISLGQPRSPEIEQMIESSGGAGVPQ
ncbi:MAG TPA: tetratricopeptide repeat protein [Verrucomicrobiota bacterium]|nr:tetratricopeptide repeat protein [Verrucomicrobiota bacterium]HNU51955.1 tetratricopeptide repeat protein [Verrucomicrobiota bacterium]